MLLSADSLTIIFVKIYCYWTRTVGVIAKGSRSLVFFETQCRSHKPLREQIFVCVLQHCDNVL